MKNKIIHFFLIFFTASGLITVSASSDDVSKEAAFENEGITTENDAALSDENKLTSKQNDDKADEESSEEVFLTQEEDFDRADAEAVSESESESEVVAEIPEDDDKALWWQGKVSVAKENELPQGIFAAVKGYYPGDTISVTNNKTMKSLEVLVIGNLEQSNQTAVIFSREAAEALKISENMEIRAYLDSRSNNLEKHEFGGAKLSILSDDEYSELSQPVSVSEDEEILAEDNTAPAENAAEEDVKDEQNAEISSQLPLPSEDTISEASEDLSYDAIVLDLSEDTADEEKSNISMTASSSDEEDLQSDDNTQKEDESSILETSLIPVSQTEGKNADSESPASEQKDEESEIKVTSASEEKGERKDRPVKKESLPYKKFIASEQMVRKGYYIQLSFLTNENNLQAFVDKYSDDLKIFLIPHKNGYKVFTGVFNDDDKNTALDYVKSMGFKDAFVRTLGK